MVAPVANVNTTDTFQTWLNTTNTLASLMSSRVVTVSSASDAGDTTNGNATLNGKFTANTITASTALKTNSVSSINLTDPIVISSPVSINSGTNTITQTFTSALGPRNAFSTGPTGTVWNTGFENPTGNAFVITVNSAGTPTFKISANGDVTAARFIGSVGGNANTATRFANDVTLSGTGDVVFSLTFNGSQNQSSAATIQANAVTNAKFRQSVGTSVVGKSSTTAGNVEDITASADGQVLRRSGGVLSFGTLDIGNTAFTTGVLPISRGGTARSAYAANRIVITNAGDGVNATQLTTTGGLFWDSTNNRMGVLTDTPQYRLDVGGSFGADTAFIGTPSTTQPQTTMILTVYGGMRANGNVTAFANITTSDVKLKENIQTVTSALDTVEKLRGVTFEWKGNDSSRKTYGLIAQEVEEVLPELVHSDGEYKGVAYANLVSVLIEAIKELRSELNELKG